MIVSLAVLRRSSPLSLEKHLKTDISRVCKKGLKRLWRNRSEVVGWGSWGFLPVKDYRLYFLDRFSGHIDEVEEFAADGDDRAIEMAGQRSNGRAMELWHRHHKLRHWDEALPALD